MVKESRRLCRRNDGTLLTEYPQKTCRTGALYCAFCTNVLGAQHGHPLPQGWQEKMPAGWGPPAEQPAAAPTAAPAAAPPPPPPPPPPPQPQLRPHQPHHPPGEPRDGVGDENMGGNSLTATLIRALGAHEAEQKALRDEMQQQVCPPSNPLSTHPPTAHPPWARVG